MLFRVTDGHVVFLRVKVRCVDLVSLAFMRHFLSQFCISYRAVCNLCVAITGSTCVVRIAVSSAKVAISVSAVTGRSAVYMR